MRRSLLIVALIVMLIALDAVANDFGFTARLLAEVREFFRLINRFVGNAF